MTLVCGSGDVGTLLSVLSVGSQIKLQRVFVLSMQLVLCHIAHRNHWSFLLQGNFYSYCAAIFRHMAHGIVTEKRLSLILWCRNFLLYFSTLCI
jgi:hypothetical protein